MMKSKVFWGLMVLVLCVTAKADANAKKEWVEQKGGNFIIYHRDVPQHFVDSVMEAAEEEFKNVTVNLGIARYQSWAWDKRAAIYIYRDEQDYVQNGGQAGWSHGAALVATKTIKTYPMANGFFDSILPHELGHIIFHEFVGLDADVPLWLDEGVAMFQEKARRLGSDQVVKKAMENGQFIPLTQLTDMRLYKNTDENTVQLFYAESASAVNFMITELGPQHFYKLCRELKEHTRLSDSLPKAYMRVKGVEDLNKQWVRYLEEQ